MYDPVLVEPDEKALRMLELESAPVAGGDGGGTAAPDEGWVRRYLQACPPRLALQLVERTRALRQALGASSRALEALGYTREAYAALPAAERATTPWAAQAGAWALISAAPGAVLRFTRGEEVHSREFVSPQEALNAAIEALEMCEGYPQSIENGAGERLMDAAAILRAWEERHDPG
jgi:hypothetical protein